MSVRFAPSPTGTFHVGNLRTAWISRQLALKLGMSWVVRYEDIDRPRVLEGAREKQREDMRRIGCVADVEQLQSDRHDRHLELFLEAAASHAVYPCFCSRKEVAEALAGLASAPHGSAPLYNGRCRELRPEQWPAARTPQIAWRFKDPQAADGSRDSIVARTDAAIGDRAALSRSFVPAYHWACAIDDFDGDHALLVRAWDLDHVTPLQRAIQAWVAAREGKPGWVPPAVYHCSLVTDDAGHRLEKRTRGVTLAELAEAGVPPELVVKRFAESFAAPDPALLRRGGIEGEVARQIALSMLHLA